MAELKGSLGSLGLPAIVQLIGELHHSGNLELTRNGSRGVLGFEDGRLVAVSYDNLRGLEALAKCSSELADGNFVFVDSVPAGERTMDLSGSELQKVLAGLASGAATAQSLEPPAPTTNATTAVVTCPLLGFVDDSTRHYARPTALHRCYAENTRAVVSANEQRELCLSGQYATCPRFRNALNSHAVSVPPATAPVAPPARTPNAAAPPPPGLAARLEAATQMSLSTPTRETTDPERSAPRPDGGPGQVAAVRPGARSGPATAPRAGEIESGSRRRRWLIAICGGLGLVLLVAGALFALRGGGFGPKLGSVAGVSVAGAPTVSNAAVPTTVALPAATSIATGQPSPTARSAAAQALAAQPTVSRATSATAAAEPAANPAGRVTAATAAPAATATSPPATAPPAGPTVATVVDSQRPFDVRFASGRVAGWIENPPFAVWRDGAYRLQAQQPTHFVAVGVPINPVPSDVIVSATFRKTGGPPGGGYGLVIRDESPAPLDGANQNMSAYVMEAGDRGEFGIWRRDGDHWVDLVPWMPSEIIRPGGSPNDLEARAVGDQLTFSVNGEELATVQDSTFPRGGVGVFVGGDNNEVALDRFRVQIPD